MKITITAPDKASMRKVFDRIIELSEIGGKAKLITRDGYEITSSGNGEYVVKQTLYGASDYCVMCGGYVVEGNQVCFGCMKKVLGKR